MNNLENINESLFENIKHINEYGQEYWIARELIQVLGYNEYRFFKKVILKAIDACKASNNEVSDHFVQVHGMVNIGSGAKRVLEDYHLYRYACYLIAMNGDSRKKAIALAQTYFAVKTRQQEIMDDFDNMTEDQKRLTIRGDLIEHNKSLVEAAQQSGVETPRDFAIFQNKGYQGLYGGLGQKEIHARKGVNVLPPKEAGDFLQNQVKKEVKSTDAHKMLVKEGGKSCTFIKSLRGYGPIKLTSAKTRERGNGNRKKKAGSSGQRMPG